MYTGQLVWLTARYGLRSDHFLRADSTRAQGTQCEAPPQTRVYLDDVFNATSAVAESVGDTPTDASAKAAARLVLELTANFRPVLRDLSQETALADLTTDGAPSTFAPVGLA